MDKIDTNSPDLEAEARSKTTSQERLKVLASINDNLAKIVAQNVAAPSELLRYLASHQSKVVRKAVTSNPNTPTETLLKLGKYFPQELLDNPIFDLLFLEDLQFFKNIPKSTLQSLIQQPEIPISLLKYAANYRVRVIADVAKMQVAVSGEMTEGWHEAAAKIIQNNLFTYDFAIFRGKSFFLLSINNFFDDDLAFFQSKSSCFLSIISNLSYLVFFQEFIPTILFKNKYFREILGEHPETSPTLLRQLVTDYIRYCTFGNTFERRDHYCRTGILENVAENPNTSLDTLKLLLAQSDSYKQFVARNPNTPPEILDKLACDKDGLVRRAVASNPNTLPDKLELLANDNSVYLLRKSVAENPSTPDKVLESFAKDSNVDIRRCVANNLGAPLKVLELLAKDSNDMIRRCVARNPNTTSDILKLLATDSRTEIRKIVARNRNTPVTILKLLIEDSNDDIRASVALNNNLPVGMLELLAKDSNDNIRTSVARNLNTPPDILEFLANDSSHLVRTGVAINHNTPLSILEFLANDSKDSVRSFLLWQNPDCNRQIKETIFKNFAKSETPSLERLALFLSDYADSSALAKNSNSISWLERYAIASNRKTPEATLKTLTRDSNRIVRATAKESLQKLKDKT